MDIKILGSCCGHARRLYDLISQYCLNNNIRATIEITEDTVEIMKYGILSTPGLVVNGILKFNGILPDDHKILSYIQEETKRQVPGENEICRNF